MLLDSNIIIYTLEPGYDFVRRFVDQRKAMVSAVSKVEVLGYHRLPPGHRQKLEDLFHALPVLPVFDPIIEQAIVLRQQRKMSLGDALIAATALVHDLGLATANYVETSVLSYLTARPSNDLRAMANQGATVEWWEIRKPNYDVVVSDLVLSEASRGHPEAARRRLAAIADLPLLRISEDVRLLAQALIENHALPEKAEADAYHIAMGAVNGVEYLLTWNCTHIANAHARPKIEATCRAFGLEPPIICTPLQLMEP